MSDIDEVKSRLNIIDIIGSRVTLKKAGRNIAEAIRSDVLHAAAVARAGYHPDPVI